MISSTRHAPLKLCLLGSRNNDGRIYNVPSESEVAALIVGDFDNSLSVRDIVIEEIGGKVKRISELHAAYLPLQYPILFCYGEDGYRDDVPYREEFQSSTEHIKMVSMREFFCYRLMTRITECSIILHSSRLLHQFIVDAYTMIESQRLAWIKTHQKELRVDKYKNLSKAAEMGENDAAFVGKRVILPSSFTGGSRYMVQNYQDAMAICRVMGYPDLFITFTCNSSWPEVQRFSKKHNVVAANRTDMLCRLFKLKLDCLMHFLKEQKLFGPIRAGIFL